MWSEWGVGRYLGLGTSGNGDLELLVVALLLSMEVTLKQGDDSFLGILEVTF